MEASIGQKKKILFVAEAATLAHVARIISLAQALRSRIELQNISMEIAFDRRFENFAPAGFQYHNLESIAVSEFVKRVNASRFPYTKEEIRQYVEDDLSLIAHTKPDLIIGDLRMSLAISSALAKVQYFSITNGHWLPSFAAQHPPPDRKELNVLGRSLASLVFSAVRPLAYRMAARPFNAVAREFKVTKAIGSLLDVYTQSDLKILVEPASWVDFGAVDDSVYVGPVSWSAPVPQPSWWSEVDWNKKTIFVSVGSSGSEQIVKLVLDATKDLDVQLIVSGVKIDSYDLRSRKGPVYSEKFISNAEVMKRVSLLISNGGSMSMVDALQNAVPVIGLTSNFDQLICAEIFVSKGLGARFGARSLNGTKLKAFEDRIRYFLNPTPDLRSRLREAQNLFSKEPQVDELVRRVKCALSL